MHQVVRHHLLQTNLLKVIIKCLLQKGLLQIVYENFRKRQTSTINASCIFRFLKVDGTYHQQQVISRLLKLRIIHLLRVWQQLVHLHQINFHFLCLNPKLLSHHLVQQLHLDLQRGLFTLLFPTQVDQRVMIPAYLFMLNNYNLLGSYLIIFVAANSMEPNLAILILRKIQNATIHKMPSFDLRL